MIARLRGQGQFLDQMQNKPLAWLKDEQVNPDSRAVAGHIGECRITTAPWRGCCRMRAASSKKDQVYFVEFAAGPAGSASRWPGSRSMRSALQIASPKPKRAGVQQQGVGICPGYPGKQCRVNQPSEQRV